MAYPKYKPDYKAPRDGRRVGKLSRHVPRVVDEMRENDKLSDYKPYKKESK